MMVAQHAARRAQVYSALATAFLYPHENWSEDLPLLADALHALHGMATLPPLAATDLPQLQVAYSQTFGAAGSLAYETEYGLPHEFRQSQELADITGFYQAFGFQMGGAVRERPDHLSVELEFMQTLAWMEARAWVTAASAEAEICADAQAKFLRDHLGLWVELFAQSLALNTPSPLYRSLAQLAADFVHADAARLGVTLERRTVQEIKHTPFDPDFSCAGCPVAEAAG